MSHRVCASFAAILVTGVTTATASAAPFDQDSPDYKLTLGRYASSDGHDATDLNLRAQQGSHTGWVALYAERAGVQQTRWGYEWRPQGPAATWWRSTFSLQNASGGAWVGSIGAEWGTDPYLIVGWGRTNLRNYINLNYDPNDMVTWGVGSRALSPLEWSLFQVVDDRLHTGQRVTHAVVRWHLSEQQRITIDVSTKQGDIAPGRYVRAQSLSLSYDHASGFVRVARDPYAGFSAADQTRVSAGWRF